MRRYVQREPTAGRQAVLNASPRVLGELAAVRRQQVRPAVAASSHPATAGTIYAQTTPHMPPSRERPAPERKRGEAHNKRGRNAPRFTPPRAGTQ